MKNYGQQDYKRIMDRVFQKYSKKTAIVEYISETKIRKYSYGVLKKAAEQLRRILENNGIYPTERVALLTKPSARSAVMLLALAYSGYTAVIPDISLPIEEQNRLLEFSMPSAIITSEDIYENIDQKLVSSIPIFRMFSDLHHQRVLKPLNPELKTPVKPDIKGNKDVIAIIFSSGTTGSAKGVEVTYQAMLYATRSCIHYAFNNKPMRLLHVLPLSHIAGYAIMQVVYLTGMQLGFVPEINASCLAMGLRCYEPTHFIMIPRVYETIRRKIETEIAKRPAPVRLAFNASRKLSSFVRRKTGYRMRWLNRPFYAPALGKNMFAMGSGAGPCDPETLKFFMDMGINMINVYGSTEAAFPISSSTIHERYPYVGVGKYNEYPYINIRIENDEILVKSMLNMNGYFRDPESTKNAFTSDGYLKTGDLGYIDSHNNLVITGRRKETIQLSNGNKISAIDVDAYYQKVCGDMRVAACGVPEGHSGTDRVVLFLETADFSDKETERTESKLRRLSDSNNSSYRLSEIIRIPELPQTTMGKIQRFKLREIALQNGEMPKSDDKNAYGKKQPSKLDKLSCSDGVCSIIQKYMPSDIQVTEDMRLSEDLNIDSITMFEICSELQTVYETDLMDHLSGTVTVKDLSEIIKMDKGDALPSVPQKCVDVRRYPLKRTFLDRGMLDIFMGISRNLYDFEVVGAEKLSRNKQYIFCPNHESHLDGLWTMAAIKGHVNCKDIACLAKQEHLDHAISRAMIHMLGGIPIDRSGNPAPALEQAIRVLRRTNVQFLVHPEGTRTRTGTMGQFKKGVAQLAIDTGLPLVPVCITGAYQIYPSDKALPKLYDFKGHKRMPLKIIFGTPIIPQKGDTAASLTEKLQNAVQTLRDGKEMCIHENRR